MPPLPPRPHEAKISPLRRTRHGLALALALASAGAAAQEGGAQATDLGDLGGGPLAYARLINDEGMIVGAAQAGLIQPRDILVPRYVPFFKAPDGPLLDISYRAETHAFEPVAMNAHGVVVGTLRAGPPVVTAPLVGSLTWSARDGHREVPAPTGYHTPVAHDIDDRGDILLTASREDYTTPFVLVAETARFVELACPDDRECTPKALGDGGAILGEATDGVREELVIWDTRSAAPRLLPLPEGVRELEPADVNRAGVVIANAQGASASGGWTSLLLVYRPGREQPEVHPDSHGARLNDHGAIAGWTLDSPSRTTATVWQPDGTELALPGLVEGLSSRAHDVNGRGVVVGAAADRNGSRAVVFGTPLARAD